MATHTAIRSDLAAVVKAAELIPKFIETSIEARALVVSELLNYDTGVDLWAMRSGLEALAEAAAVAEGRLQGQSRAATYIFQVAMIADALKGEGIRMSSSGGSKCRAVLDVCFEAIEIRKSSEAAIRAYLRDLRPPKNRT